MSQINTNQFIPDYAVAPGRILEETLESIGLSKSEFADRAGVSAKTVSQIIAGIAPIVPDNAIVFERVLGISAQIWNNIESEYRLFLARQKATIGLKDAVEWSKKFPLAELVKRRVIAANLTTAQKVDALLNFFRVKDPDAWMTQYGNVSVAFYKSAKFQSDYESVVTWLRLAELRAESIQTDPFDAARFQDSLASIRSLTAENLKVFEPRMKDLCRQSGVALVFISELSGTHLSGATRWLSPDKAMIALSLRHKSNDHFWFTFFHESGHILKHGKKDVYIDEQNAEMTKQEQEASQFASSFLIPDSQYRDFITKNPKPTKYVVEQFAKKTGIAPGILVGRLQYDKHISFSYLNNLKAKFTLIENDASKS